MAECANGDNRTLLMLSVTLLKLFLSEKVQSWCGDVYHKSNNKLPYSEQSYKGEVYKQTKSVNNQKTVVTSR